MRPAAACALLVGAAAFAAGRPSFGYVRYVTGAGVPFYWAQASVAITAYPNDFTQATMTADQVSAAVDGAAAAWSSAENACTYLQLVPSFSMEKTPLAVYDGHNSLIFRNTSWCELMSDGTTCDVEYDPTALAFTTDTANTETGQLYDADIQVNVLDYQWADVVEDPTLAGDMDLQNALTHEMGHLIGLDHTCYMAGPGTVRPDDNTGAPVPDCAGASAAVAATTMFPSATPGDTQKRTLAPDDQNGLCTIYSINDPPPPPGTAVTGGCAQCATAGRPSSFAAAAAVAALGALAQIWRTRRRRAPARARRG